MRTTQPRRIFLGLMLAAVTGCGSTVQLQGSGSLDGISSGGLDIGQNVAQAPEATVRTEEASRPAPTASAAPDVIPREDSTSDSGLGGTTTGPSAAAATLAPVRVGFLAAGTGSSAQSAIGRDPGASNDGVAMLKGMVNYFNAHGGLAGHKITPVYVFIDALSTDWETQAQSACATLTQDNRVDAVISIQNNYYSTTFTPCIQKAGIPNIALLVGGVDDVELSKYSTLISPVAPSINRRFKALINGLTRNGFLAPKNKIGVIVEDCPQNNRAYATTVEPMLSAAKIPHLKRTINCAQGFGDAAGIIAAFGNSVLPFKAAGVDRVMLVTGFEQLGSGTFEKQAKSQSYYPSYALTSTSSVGVNDMQMPDGSLSRVQAVGWSPVRDVTTLEPGNANTKRCLSMLKPYRVSGDRANLKEMEGICDGFFILEAALAKTGGSAAAASILRAVGQLGSAFQSATALSGLTQVTSSRRDGPQNFAVSTYRASCVCFAYSTKPAPLA